MFFCLYSENFDLYLRKYKQLKKWIVKINSYQAERSIMTKKSKPKSEKPKSQKKTRRTPKITNYKEAISLLLNQNSRKSYSIKQIFKDLNVHQEEIKMQMVGDLEALLNEKEIVLTKDDKFRGNLSLQILEGTVDFVNPRFAFVVVEGREEDIWVSVNDLKFALDGDKVRIKIYPTAKGRRPEGEVIEVLERKRSEFVGKIEISERYAFVIADNRKMYIDIFVPANSISTARNGDKVIVKIVEWHTEKNSPVGIVKEVLGKAGTHNTEMHAILAEYDLPLNFHPDLIKEAEKIKLKLTKLELKKRKDFRNITTFTIDPEDAKDFDDALSIRKLENGNWEIGVHIADVTHYVKPESLLEKEAYNRATSVYLVDRVVPMLPEHLSNELCSLKPNEDRLTFSAVFEIDEDANILNQWFGRTIIHSDKRFSYEEAFENIESGEGAFANELRLLNGLAKKLTAKRFKAGAINFETTEVKFKLDENGVPLGIFVKERKDSHKLIEEFMLLANQKVAEFVFFKKNAQNPDGINTMVYRIHEKPDSEKLQNFAGFAKKFGYDIALNGIAMVSSINRLIQNSEGTPQQNVLQSLAIRTMAKARYSAETVGHFGLAFKHYTHFTSPIRRYPDMMVHRLVQMYLDNQFPENRNEFEQKCKHSTDMEKRAADAERASIKYKQVEYMQLMEDKIYDGIVTGVTEWGIYVEIIETKCEGMVRMSDMIDDFYELDAENYRVVGKRTKRVITFGDAAKVRVKDTNLEKRTMDLFWVE